MKMPSDSDKTKPREITKHISDKLFAARCNKYVPVKGAEVSEATPMGKAGKPAKLLTIRA